MINTTRLRCTIGWLGLLLPWIVAALLWVIPPSISDTYYEPQTITPFVVILGAAAFAVYRAKKTGKKCIGCPESCSCSGGCNGCSCDCGKQ